MGLQLRVDLWIEGSDVLSSTYVKLGRRRRLGRRKQLLLRLKSVSPGVEASLSSSKQGGARGALGLCRRRCGGDWIESSTLGDVDRSKLLRSEVGSDVDWVP